MGISQEEKEKRYLSVMNVLASLVGEKGKYAVDEVGTMALVSAVIKMYFPELVFVGFYRVTRDRMLCIGPYQGTIIACGTIPFHRGVCGACATKRETIVVPDVKSFPGYIACDDETASEIVVPVFQNGTLTAVLDIDAAEKGYFLEKDKYYLEKIVHECFSVPSYEKR